MSALKRPNFKLRRDAPWTLSELKQLGKVPDSVLARRAGRTIKEVVAERERRRIALPTPPRRWTAREIKMLGRLNDYEIARRLRRTPDQVREQRCSLGIAPLRPHHVKKWRRAEEKLLGKVPDSELARRLGRSVYSVHAHRLA